MTVNIVTGCCYTMLAHARPHNDVSICLVIIISTCPYHIRDTIDNCTLNYYCPMLYILFIELCNCSFHSSIGMSGLVTDCGVLFVSQTTWVKFCSGLACLPQRHLPSRSVIWCMESVLDTVSWICALCKQLVQKLNRALALTSRNEIINFVVHSCTRFRVIIILLI